MDVDMVATADAGKLKSERFCTRHHISKPDISRTREQPAE